MDGLTINKNLRTMPFGRDRNKIIVIFVRVKFFIHATLIEYCGHDS